MEGRFVKDSCLAMIFSDSARSNGRLVFVDKPPIRGYNEFTVCH